MPDLLDTLHQAIRLEIVEEMCCLQQVDGGNPIELQTPQSTCHWISTFHSHGDGLHWSLICKEIGKREKGVHMPIHLCCHKSSAPWWSYNGHFVISLSNICFTEILAKVIHMLWNVVLKPQSHHFNYLFISSRILFKITYSHQLPLSSYCSLMFTHHIHRYMNVKGTLVRHSLFNIICLA